MGAGSIPRAAAQPGTAFEATGCAVRSERFLWIDCRCDSFRRRRRRRPARRPPPGTVAGSRTGNHSSSDRVGEAAVPALRVHRAVPLTWTDWAGWLRATALDALRTLAIPPAEVAVVLVSEATAAPDKR